MTKDIMPVKFSDGVDWDVRVPRLGPAPEPDGRFVFKSLISYDGLPSEYSWKWNTTGDEPDIRYSWEAVNDASGTAGDRLNHGPTLEYMEKVSTVPPAPTSVGIVTSSPSYITRIGPFTLRSYQCTEKGEPDFKSYIAPELYRRARYAPFSSAHAGKPSRPSNFKSSLNQSCYSKGRVRVRLE